MPGSLTILPFGPFSKGVQDTGNPSIGLQGALRGAKGLYFSGSQRLGTRSGNQVALTFKDDQGSPANVTSVRYVGPFADRAVAIAHSTVTNKAYLYVLTPALDGWYNTAGVLQANLTPQPAGVLWTGITTPPDVCVSEGLGTLYVAHTQALDAAGLYFASKQWDGTYAVTITTMKASGTGGTVGADDAYFLGLIAFQEHLWAWGFGTGATPATAYRPELARFSQPNFLPFQTADSIAVGDRVRSEREKIIAAGVAGSSLLLAGPYLVSRVTGSGRSSWYKEPVDRSHGIVGAKAGVTGGADDEYWYFYSQRGPMRIGDSGPPEPLWGGVASLVKRVVNPERIVATRMQAEDSIVFAVDTGAGVRNRVAFDVTRQLWTAIDDDMGIVIAAGGEVDVVKASTAPGVSPPTGPPTAASTTAIGASTAQANWTPGDVTAQTQMEIRVQGASTWTVVTTLAAGVTSYVFSGLTLNVAYEWRAAHVKAGQFSTYLGPSASTQFTTIATLQPPTNLAGNEILSGNITVSWTNSGESGVSTEIYFSGPITHVSTLVQTAGVGESSKTIAVSEGNGNYDVLIRHTKSGVNPSSFVGPVTVNVT